MRLLVTGGAGFIGSNFVHFWLERYPDDHLVAGVGLDPLRPLGVEQLCDLARQRLFGFG